MSSEQIKTDSAAQPDPERIRARAYEIYEARHGGGGGDDLADWIQAEQELRQHAPASAPPRPTTSNAASRGDRLLKQPGT